MASGLGAEGRGECLEGTAAERRRAEGRGLQRGEAACLCLCVWGGLDGYGLPGVYTGSSRSGRYMSK